MTDSTTQLSLPAPATIALLTDFGYQDAYVGVMKGVILSRCPQAQLVDLTHGVPPQDVLAGALHLLAAVPYFAPGTIFLAVVDPGVGSARRPICIQSGDYRFVGPDNGLLWPAAAHCGRPQTFHLDKTEHWLPGVGATFHGRDVFSPIAAALANGHVPEELGSPTDDPVKLEFPIPTRTATGVQGEVIYVDHFGNAITNLQPEDLNYPDTNAFTFNVSGQSLRGPATHYGAVPIGAPVVVRGSFSYYEIAVNGGHAASRFNLQRGSMVLVAE